MKKLLEELKTILFPFYKKRPKLKEYWWHRLLVVLFSIILIFIFFNKWWSLNQEQVNGRQPLFNAYYSLYKNDPVKLNQEITDLEKVFPVTVTMNGLNSFQLIIITSYLLQIFYYKIVLFIVFGNKKHITNHIEKE